MANCYSLNKVDNSIEWDRFIMSTNYGTIFQYSSYLNALEVRHSKYFIYNKKELRAAIVLVENSNGTEVGLNDFIIYNGIIIGAETTGQYQSHKVSEQFRISEFVAENLPTLYKKIEFSLTPKNKDIRPFLWFNYGVSSSCYKIEIRYTSFVNISDFSGADTLDDISLYRQAAKARRQIIRYAKRDGVKTREEFNLEAFISLYLLTMSRQELEVSKDKLEIMKRLLSKLHHNDLVKMYISRTNEGKIGSIACFAVDHVRAYYLFGASDPGLRDGYTGTAVLWDAFTSLSYYGVNEVDLEGVNSPNRGWFKLSFGGSLESYYELRFNHG